MNDTNNKRDTQAQLYYLCNDAQSDADNECKKLIEMINVIVLEKLLTDTYKNNDIYEAVLKEQINKSKNQLIVSPMTKNEYEEYKKNNEIKIEKFINDFLNNMMMNNMGQQPMVDNNGEDEEGEEGEQEGEEEEKKIISKRIPKGGNIRRKISYKKLPQSKNKQINIHKKSKRIRKI